MLIEVCLGLRSPSVQLLNQRWASSLAALFTCVRVTQAAPVTEGREAVSASQKGELKISNGYIAVQLAITSARGRQRQDHINN